MERSGASPPPAAQHARPRTPIGARLARWRARPPLLPPPLRTPAWRLAVLLFAVALLTLPIAWTVRFSAQSEWWWDRGFNIHDAERRTGLERSQLDAAGADLRAYFLSDAQRADFTVTTRDGRTEPLFTEREVLHMIDVKRLLNRTYDAGWAAIGFLIAFLAGVWYWRRPHARDALASAAFYAGAGVVLAIAALTLVAISGFDSAFRQFHLLFFTNDLWQLSSRDRLIQMFPQGFFFETTMLIGGATIALAAATAGAGWWWRRRDTAHALERTEPENASGVAESPRGRAGPG